MLEAKLYVQHSVQIKWFHSNGGREFVSLQPYLQEQGIRFTMTVHVTPEQNGMIGRRNQVYQKCISVMLQDAGLLVSLWSYVFLHSVYL